MPDIPGHGPPRSLTSPDLELDRCHRQEDIPSQEQMAIAEPTQTRAATTGIGQKSSALPLSYRGGQMQIQMLHQLTGHDVLAQFRYSGHNGH